MSPRFLRILLLVSGLLMLGGLPACSDKASKGGEELAEGSSEGHKKARKKKKARTPEKAEAAAAAVPAKGKAGSAEAKPAEEARTGSEASPQEAVPQAQGGEKPSGESAFAAGPDEGPAVAPEGAGKLDAPAAPPMPSAEVLGPPPPRVEHLLSVADLVAVLHTKGWVTVGPLAGRKPDENYNSIQYEKPGTGRVVTLQLWKGSREEAIGWWNNHLATWPNAQAQENMVTQDTFFWNRGHLFGLVFLDTAKGMVVALTCHTEICSDTQLLQLTLTAFGRLKK